jgi:hypothetical protein
LHDRILPVKDIHPANGTEHIGSASAICPPIVYDLDRIAGDTPCMENMFQDFRSIDHGISGDIRNGFCQLIVAPTIREKYLKEYPAEIFHGIGGTKKSILSIVFRSFPSHEFLSSNITSRKTP